MAPEPDSDSFAERLARILDVFALPPHELGFMQIVRLTGLPRASVHRIVGQLLAIGYLQPCESGRSYRLGTRLCGLVQASLDMTGLQDLAAPVLNDLARRFRMTSFAARLTGGEVMLFASANPDDPGEPHLHPAHGRRPLHACSSAKAILAFLPDEFRAGLLASAPREGFTHRTLTGDTALHDEFRRIRACGYAVCDGEIHEGIVSLAVPVPLGRTESRLALGLIGLGARMPPEERQSTSEGLKFAARRLAALLLPTGGFPPAEGHSHDTAS
ncbi:MULTISPECIES: IclR family transcriptional regulator [Gemmobacter]|jgi:DNA-binding IclR family transcriptional regulator|uniref:Transcriptional regulator n=1 Tax=Gemmobacter nanjingensis TaxID=488454 RepID=A0ABQ3FHT5_9RHOB|nr:MULTISPECIES: IclR family transcriptional regulator [Gemmobacter]GHC24941.1 transcriptional regulator [Gemmobacter nanjingensis]